MLTPQEAESHVFPKASFGGYNMVQVDTFLDSLVADYRTLYQENTSLKNKMKVLVDKVEEYRATEDAMRRALHSAQKMAEELVREGEAYKQASMDQAEQAARQRSEEVCAELARQEAEAQAKLDAVQTALANEQARLEAARTSTTAYVGKLKELYTQELQYIGSLSQLTAAPAQPAQESEAAPTAPAPEAASVQAEHPAPEEVAQDIEASMARIFDGPAESDLGDTRAFDQIQYGKDYEIE